MKRGKDSRSDWDWTCRRGGPPPPPLVQIVACVNFKGASDPVHEPSIRREGHASREACMLDDSEREACGEVQVPSPA